MIPIIVFSQIDQNILPFSFNNKVDFKLIDNYIINSFDIDKFLLEDNDDAFYKQYSFAQSYDLDLNFDDCFFIETDSFFVKYLKISIPNTYGTALYFSNFNLLNDEKVFVYNQSKSYLIGAFTSLNNKQNGFLHTRFLPDDTIIVEYQKLKINTLKDIEIQSVAGAYRSIFNGSDWCEININCDTLALWQTVKKSVAKITYKDDDNDKYYVCTGQLVANTSIDQTPYFLTANHCLNSESEANSAIFYFNYEAEDCLLDEGDDNQTISGATLIATANNKIDFTLLQLSAVPPEIYDPYYVGWSRVDVYSDTSICIHHPAGDIKKISKNYTPLLISSFSGYDFDKHWQIDEWNEGTTEGGSSGSGLFTSNGLLIGTLSGGDASCDYNYNDLYQQFYHEWDDYNLAQKQLAYWLDPYGVNPMQMQGYFPYKNINLPKPNNLKALLTDSLVEITWEASNPPADKYFVYKNLELLAETIEPVTLYDVLIEDSVYVYYATAVFDEQESKPSNFEVIVFGDTSRVPKVTEIRMFPNPALNQFSIITPDTIPITKIEIYNYNGLKVVEQEVNILRNVTIDVSDLPPSWYIIRIYTTGDIYTRKLIKYIDY